MAILFLRMAEERGLEPAGQVQRLAEQGSVCQTTSLLLRMASRYHSALLTLAAEGILGGEALRNALSQVNFLAAGRLAAADLGRVYEQMLGPSGARKAAGIYYTPDAIVSAVVRATVGRMLGRRSGLVNALQLRILDPACGCGAFLLAAFDYLWKWYRRNTDLASDAVRQRILMQHLHGVDRDPLAVEVTRLALILKAAETGGTLIPDLAGTIRCGDALIDFDWNRAFPTVMRQGGFTVVLGNPPWGQKGIDASAELKRHLVERYPSSAGIFDWFRPFVEQGVRLTAPGGQFGMVLPDIVLLKDYPQSRRFLLDQLALERIDWWGRAFAAATIDSVSIVGRKESAPARHRVAVQVHEQPPLTHAIPQADFLANPRFVFNLHLTPDRRRVIDQLAGCPRLGDYFEIHEGVHSGNIRTELFVSERVDATCRPLVFGRDEITPYRLRWQGRYIRLAAMPEKKCRERYANLGRPGWHERPKVLVRRTGDFLLAAVDGRSRYASNNFFLVFPRRPCSLTLDGLCALLNSRFMTWYFRTVEPRRGRVFAEVKIKHLRAFPLPAQAEQPDGCRRLNDLGARRRKDATLDAAIDREVKALFGIEENNKPEA